MDERILPDAALVNGTAAVGTAEGPESSDEQPRTDGTAPAAREGLTPTFLAGLAAAMRETAVRERDRISGVVADDAAAHVEKVRSRAAIETEELRRLAEEDVEHINQWSAAEIERVKTEATQKIDDRRSSLDVYLKQHDTIIDTEIEGVNSAVRDYEATLDRFFSELSAETDPASIVRRAGQLPAPPDLDEIRATARANAMTHLAEMGPQAAGETAPTAQTEAAVEAAPEPEGEAAPVMASAEATDSTEPVEAAESMQPTAESVSPDQGDNGLGPMTGVMDDGVGSIEPSELTEPTESTEEVAVAEAETPVASDGETADPSVGPEPSEEPGVPAPVAVMDPDAQRVPSWPAPAPTMERAQIAPTIDHTSAAVRLLRSVAPWTAPTHASRGSSDQD